MRCLKRNKQSFWYCNPTGETVDCYDQYGNLTGERIVRYDDPVQMFANVSPATGVYRTEEFGSLENYDKVILVEGTDCPIAENTVLFVDKEPELAEVSTYQLIAQAGGVYVPSLTVVFIQKYDYTVWRVSKSLNYTAIAIRKASVGGEPYNPDPGPK